MKKYMNNKNVNNNVKIWRDIPGGEKEIIK